MNKHNGKPDVLISNSLIFIHNPRTGGSSVREYLKNAFPANYYPSADTSLSDKQKIWINHQGLAIAYQYAGKLGLDPFTIPSIVCIRNPYSLAVSGYKYLAQRWKDQVGDLEDSFPEYLSSLVNKTPKDKLDRMANSPFGPFSGFLMIGDKVPSNLTIARTESLVDDVASFLDKLAGERPVVDFPHKNRSNHTHFSDYSRRKASGKPKYYNYCSCS